MHPENPQSTNTTTTPENPDATEPRTTPATMPGDAHAAPAPATPGRDGTIHATAPEGPSSLRLSGAEVLGGGDEEEVGGGGEKKLVGKFGLQGRTFFGELGDTREEEGGEEDGWGREKKEMEGELRGRIVRTGWSGMVDNAQIEWCRAYVSFVGRDGKLLSEWERWGESIAGYFRNEGSEIGGVYADAQVKLLDIENAASHAHGMAIRDREVMKAIEECVKEGMRVLTWGR